MSDTGKLTTIIVTPEGEKFKGEVSELIAPGHDGYFTVLPGHTEFFTRNPPGVLVLRDAGREQLFAVGRGFIEVANDTVQLVVQTAERAENIDAERARDARERAEKTMEGMSRGLDDADYQHQLLREARAKARLDAVNKVY